MKNILTNIDFKRFVEGDELVFRKIFDGYHQILYRYAYSVTKCKFDSEDAVQEAFVQLFKANQQIKDISHIYPYLFVVVKRVLIQSFRKKVLNTEFLNSSKLTWSENSHCTEQQIEFNDLTSFLTSIMNDLSEKEKEAYALNKLKGLNYDEISEYTGTSRNTIKNQIISASKKIRLRLAKYYFLLLTLEPLYISIFYLWGYSMDVKS
ncbi:RNA polymerase sigma factor [Sphingobacterium rhinopitheci]|uniref:RNA polymerase sigma factor n=1 Tax=Sphingobacterium rhinopitheci TaxID=2781960 RepID=UPI001F51F920|nr:RNA polymerase sigma factor [Sphingobacterium rhinopitheci]MCI0922706.1 RNA polymerase sigma factor [Sphingobacterium rhinopitheci]